MKYFFIYLIRCYQIIVSPILASLLGPLAGCRFEKSCSEFALEAIKSKGVARGAYLSARRILTCQPFTQ